MRDGCEWSLPWKSIDILNGHALSSFWAVGRLSGHYPIFEFCPEGGVTSVRLKRNPASSRTGLDPDLISEAVVESHSDLGSVHERELLHQLTCRRCFPGSALSTRE